MNNNDVLRRLRYVLDINDAGLVALFALGGRAVTEPEVWAWMGREGEPGSVECDDRTLELLLDALIVDRRGPPPAHAKPPKPVPFTNNAILKKLRVAFALREDDMIALFALGGRPLSKAELGGLTRPPTHRHYRDCGNQLLRAFLGGLAKQNRG